MPCSGGWKCEVTETHVQTGLPTNAECVAAETGALATVTGDALGQVSSQTLPNLAVISEASSLPVLRPLVGMNKDEILAIARRIGTFDLSKQVDEYCALVPRRPATSDIRR